MITHIDVDGFKSLRGFSLEFEPLTAIIGANGAGKSNLLLLKPHWRSSEPAKSNVAMGRSLAHCRPGESTFVVIYMPLSHLLLRRIR